MESYPPDYVRHELPLVALLGLGDNPKSSSGDLVASSELAPGAAILREQPEVSPQFARSLQDGFYRADGSSLPWNGSSLPQRNGLMGFNFTSAGSKYIFPRRKAAPAAQTPTDDAATPSGTSYASVYELHSTLSPLSPTSPLFPDGLFTPLWLRKHQQSVPSVLLCFYELLTGHSAVDGQDEMIRAEISRIRTSLTRSGHKTRLAVALLCDRNNTEIDDRISNIRRSSGLDRSAFFFLCDPQAQADLNNFVLDILTALQPVCIEYYRDLTKHSRRKKNRGYIPAPSAAPGKDAPQPLALSGWNARYDFKQGIFAEYRQEMDAAERHFSSALDELFSEEGILETTPFASPKWREALDLADASAMRVLRCQLWRGLTTGAAESWANYRDRTRALIERRSPGDANDGIAWETRWTQLMAELVARSSLPVFDTEAGEDEKSGDDADETNKFVVINVLAPPEKAYATVERLPPFQFLHHAGYWYRKAQSWALQRFRAAQSATDSEVFSEKAALAKTLHTDIDVLGAAAEAHFTMHKQFRMRSHVALERARILLEDRRHEDALEVLSSVWTDMQWRSEGWWALAREVLQAIFGIAITLGEHRLAAEIRWEMLSEVFGNRFSESLGLSVMADGAADGTPVTIDVPSRLSPISLSFCFATDQAHVGDILQCQVMLTTSPSSSKDSLSIEAIHLSLSGNIDIHISNKETTSANSLQDVKLRDTTSSGQGSRVLVGDADLTASASHTHVLVFGLPLRMAGDLDVSTASVDVKMSGWTIQQNIAQSCLKTSSWWYNDGTALQRRDLSRTDSVSAEILPKPPKIQLRLSNPDQQYFAGEDVSMGLVIVNEEAEPVDGTIRIDTPEEICASLDLSWSKEDSQTSESRREARMHCPISPGDEQEHKLHFRTPRETSNLVLSIAVTYTIGAEKDTIVNTNATFHFAFTQPLHAEFELYPRHDSEQWPSFFILPQAPEDKKQHVGIRQQWLLATHVLPNSEHPLVVESLTLKAADVAENILCEIPDSAHNADSITLSPEGPQEVSLPFSTRRTSLDDRRSSSISLELHATWRRQATPDAATCLTVIPVPTFQMPAAEPRVLCTAAELAIDAAEAAVTYQPCGRTLIYTIENPSTHFLTFSLAMDASDQFAFSGPKLRNISLTPLSRKVVRYNVILLDVEQPDSYEGVKESGSNLAKGAKGKWIFPSLQVTDSYFNKTLRVEPAGPGVKYPKEDRGAAIAVWVPI